MIFRFLLFGVIIAMLIAILLGLWTPFGVYLANQYNKAYLKLDNYFNKVKKK